MNTTTVSYAARRDECLENITSDDAKRYTFTESDVAIGADGTILIVTDHSIPETPEEEEAAHTDWMRVHGVLQEFGWCTGRPGRNDIGEPVFDSDNQVWVWILRP
jgi:hypothetical protein